MGKYMLCKTYPNGQSCKIGENRCSFPHFKEEIQFWILDRNDQFDIETFIATQRTNLRQGWIWFLY